MRCPRPHPCGAHDFGCTQRGALDPTHATRSPGAYNYSRTTHGSGALPATLLTSPSSCTRAIGAASILVVATGKGYTGGTSGQSSSNDHMGEVGLLTSDR
jgi:hypothetical protein